MISSDPLGPRWRIGFYPGPPQIRMEEEESPSSTSPPDYGRTEKIGEAGKQGIQELLRQRAVIIDSIGIAELSFDEKFKLIEETRLLMTQLNPPRFATEKVIYSILIFSAVVILMLAPLTAMGKLPPEITVTFIGTAVGGTIATIAQKLGKIGR
ncbi:hypothetical protein [Bradyrhizobium sp. UFLA05-112]